MPVSPAVIAGVVVVLLIVGAVFMWWHGKSKKTSAGGASSGTTPVKPALPPFTYLFNYFMWSSKLPGTVIAILNPPGSLSTTPGPNPLPAAYLNSTATFSAATGFTVTDEQMSKTLLTGTAADASAMASGATATKISASSSILNIGTNNYVHINGVPLLAGLAIDTVYSSTNLLVTFT